MAAMLGVDVELVDHMVGPAWCCGQPLDYPVTA